MKFNFTVLKKHFSRVHKDTLKSMYWHFKTYVNAKLAPNDKYHQFTQKKTLQIETVLTH